MYYNQFLKNGSKKTVNQKKRSPISPSKTSFKLIPNTFFSQTPFTQIKNTRTLISPHSNVNIIVKKWHHSTKKMRRAVCTNHTNMHRSLTNFCMINRKRIQTNLRNRSMHIQPHAKYLRCEINRAVFAKPQILVLYPVNTFAKKPRVLFKNTD